MKYKTSYLLNVDKNIKTAKSRNFGYLTGILYLAPDKLAFEYCRQHNINLPAELPKTLCSHSNVNCRQLCLGVNGRFQMSPVKLAGIKRAVRFLQNDPHFYLELIDEINALVRKAERNGLKPAIRLNGTSDINWQLIKVADNKNMFELFPNIMWYDYTKNIRIWTQARSIKNHHVVFSYSGTNWAQCQLVLKQGGQLSVPFRSFVPTKWKNYKVSNGDIHDLLFKHQHKIIGLIAKGKAIHSTSSFIIQN